jgi:riboflavin kinase / FMN adenylyltransferase
MAYSSFVYRGLSSKITRPSVLTIGSFDGIHRGHAALLRRVAEHAQGLSVPATLVTFYPHPLSVLRPGSQVPTLSSLRKLSYDAFACGIQQVVSLRFTKEMANLSSQVFLADWILKGLSPFGVVVGEDAAVGRDREGTIEAMREFFNSHKVFFEVVPFLYEGNQKVGSREVRRALAGGDLHHVQKLLDRPYSLEGKVIHGNQRGRTLGFPTANSAPLGQEVPPFGVYRSLFAVNNVLYRSVTNIGVRPTFQGNSCSIETHVLDGFNEDVYGCRSEIFLLEFLRPEQKFDSIEDLIRQIKEDCRRACTIPDKELLDKIVVWRGSLSLGPWFHEVNFPEVKVASSEVTSQISDRSDSV